MSEQPSQSDQEIQDLFVEEGGAPEAMHWLAHVQASHSSEVVLLEAGHTDANEAKRRFLEILHSLIEQDKHGPIKGLLAGLEEINYREFEERIGDQSLSEWERVNPREARLLEEQRATQFAGLHALYQAGRNSA
jgi:molybdopterin-guanine dinucleotide biosynthesis protein A